ncbi:hypothetical protein CERZMDRAFT_101836 [Cercospora zeae-maydis SCOH1-5]|uniref:Uncharacterized protein n=1 Tax=Cercospora zeae-maydis SCOH1-5 TaxID=717836 RepID=A0A6A6F3F0_9PEZI|nr:hypothetical protein CERZMDRAFT_101836 [Cercospora zeae-maydis SCOH1-5]
MSLVGYGMSSYSPDELQPNSSPFLQLHRRRRFHDQPNIVPNLMPASPAMDTPTQSPSMKAASPPATSSISRTVSTSPTPIAHSSPAMKSDESPETTSTASPDISPAGNNNKSPEATSMASPDMKEGESPGMKDAASPDMKDSVSPDLKDSASPDLKDSASPDLKEAACSPRSRIGVSPLPLASVLGMKQEPHDAIIPLHIGSPRYRAVFFDAALPLASAPDRGLHETHRTSNAWEKLRSAFSWRTLILGAVFLLMLCHYSLPSREGQLATAVARVHCLAPVKDYPSHHDASASGPDQWLLRRFPEHREALAVCKNAKDWCFPRHTPGFHSNNLLNYAILATGCVPMEHVLLHTAHEARINISTTTSSGRLSIDWTRSGGSARELTRLWTALAASDLFPVASNQQHHRFSIPVTISATAQCEHAIIEAMRVHLWCEDFGYHNGRIPRWTRSNEGKTERMNQRHDPEKPIGNHVYIDPLTACNDCAE